jgi:hypothetical protein
MSTRGDIVSRYVGQRMGQSSLSVRQIFMINASLAAESIKTINMLLLVISAAYKYTKDMKRGKSFLISTFPGFHAFLSRKKIFNLLIAI